MAAQPGGFRETCDYVQPKVDLLEWSTWRSLFKFWGMMMLQGLIIVIVVLLILSVFGLNGISSIILFAASVMCQATFLIFFEQWDDCYKRECKTNQY